MWFCGLKKKKMAGVTPQTKLTVSLEVQVEMFIFMTSFKRFAGSGLAWSDSCCNDIQQCSISFMYPSLYSHFLIDSSVYWLGWLGILASHAPWLAPESVFALSLPSGGEYYAELWLLAAWQPAECGLLLHSYSPPSPLSLLVYFESFLAILPFLRDYSFPCGSS